MYLSTQPVEGMGMFTGKEKDKAGQHTLRDQGTLHYSVCSLWTLKSRATVIQVPMSSSRWSIINYSHRCFLRQLRLGRSWLKHKAVLITFPAKFFINVIKDLWFCLGYCVHIDSYCLTDRGSLSTSPLPPPSLFPFSTASFCPCLFLSFTTDETVDSLSVPSY